MKIKDIENVITSATLTGIREVKLQINGSKIKIVTYTPPSNGQQTIILEEPSPALAPPVPTPEEASLSNTPDPTPELVIERSMHVGTLYLETDPGKPHAVTTGQIVEKGELLCTVVSMNIVNEVNASCSGKIVDILVDNASPIAYNDPIFKIEPV